MVYSMIKKALFQFDPEKTHKLAINFLKMIQSMAIARQMFENRLTINDKRLETQCLGLKFQHPIGLAAGFDKNAEVYRALSCLGFGAVEVGSITPQPQDGNTKPRLYRLPEDQAIINRMGFNNDGMAIIKKRIENQPKISVPLGINLGKNKSTLIEEAHLDYEKGLEHFYLLGEYFVINISSPNTEHLRNLQFVSSLEPFLDSIMKKRVALASQYSVYKPILLKIAPDLNDEEIDQIIHTSIKQGIDGFIITNTTVKREHLQSTHKRESGGLSGKPLASVSNEIIKRVYRITQGDVPIIGSGGVFTGRDAYEKMKAGANLIQLYTGFIYQGPAIVKHINNEFISLMNQDQVASISEIVGIDSSKRFAFK
ncbi:quinone-dependent dihydroorotate dehydrogenase [Bacillus sp. CLL-7-23]|uniref:Dihydroorotate dehydrogenase (quinone) n=1 Tax=Bacillus changyiensis TaxID=3004103 RepID=A0ABT4X3N6_9BACI|nr:quinone-dependent dihydroorotate dehydrogenase [Bacillus changyiensis]MDA7026354.1 quinone-dependent dihydroorotate dehydrogenase [Bacillus changyiensis]